jgi:putative methionine-R-sulfoxide reductase with GAF domain
VSERVLDELAQVLEQGGEPDDLLRAVVAVLAAEPRIAWAGIAFLEDGQLVLGPQAGAPDDERRVRVPVEFQAEPVGELWVDGDVDEAFLERVAALVSAHVLIGWDTGGKAWEP